MFCSSRDHRLMLLIARYGWHVAGACRPAAARVYLGQSGGLCGGHRGGRKRQRVENLDLLTGPHGAVSGGGGPWGPIAGRGSALPMQQQRTMKKRGGPGSARAVSVSGRTSGWCSTATNRTACPGPAACTPRSRDCSPPVVRCRHTVPPNTVQPQLVLQTACSVVGSRWEADLLGQEQHGKGWGVGQQLRPSHPLPICPAKRPGSPQLITCEAPEACSRRALVGPLTRQL